MLEHRTKWKWTCKCIDFESDVQEFKILDEPNLESVVDNLSHIMQALEIRGITQFHQNRNWGSKTKRTCLMDTRNAYKKVPCEGQKTTSTRWVVSPEVIDGVMPTKARLVARGFKEKEDQTTRSDDPTYLRECMSVLQGSSQ